MSRSLRTLTSTFIFLYLLFVIGGQAVFFSLLEGGISLPTPLATDNQSASISIELMEIAAITFRVDSADFNNGFINVTCNNCTMSTDDTSDTDCCHLDWGNPPDNGLLLENTGNQFVALSILASENASSWLNGTLVQPSFQFKINNLYSDNYTSFNSSIPDVDISCLSGFSATDYTELTTVEQYVCGNATSFDFHHQDNRDEAHLRFKVVLPRDAPKGTKAVTVQMIATT